LTYAFALERNPTHEEGLITGITGPGGSYLADFAAEKGYEVHGTFAAPAHLTLPHRPSYTDPHINGVRMFLHYGDLSIRSNLGQTSLQLKAG